MSAKLGQELFAAISGHGDPMAKTCVGEYLYVHACTVISILRDGIVQAG